MPLIQTPSPSHPWQTIVAGHALTLHAPLTQEGRVALDPEALKAEYTEVERMVDVTERTHFCHDGSWSGITLFTRASFRSSGGPTPALARMPSLERLFADTNWPLLDCHLSRTEPHGILPWHSDPQGPFSDESRLILPVHAPPGAVTLIGDGAIAYPEGIPWIGDFRFPHQVENRSDRERVVLLIDVKNTPDFLASLPSAITNRRSERERLAGKATNAMLLWRASRNAIS